MDMNENIGVYAEAKGEYTRQADLGSLLPALPEYLLELVEGSKRQRMQILKGSHSGASGSAEGYSRLERRQGSARNRPYDYTYKV
jgi:hypothetical protein